MNNSPYERFDSDDLILRFTTNKNERMTTIRGYDFRKFGKRACAKNYFGQAGEIKIV